MAGEKLAKITLRASWSRDDFTRGFQAAQVRFRLAGTWYTYQIGVGPGKYIVPDPDDDDGGQHDYVKNGVANILALVKAAITQGNLPYLVSELRDLGDDALSGRPVVEFDIAALDYRSVLDLAFEPAPSVNYAGHDTTRDSGWQEMANQGTVFPLLATARVTNATRFGSATGAIDIVLSQYNGLAGGVRYVWADDATLPLNTYGRDRLAAATYRCTITDGAGASTIVTASVASDLALTVQVNATGTTAELVPSGGLAPYTFLWADDRSTGATRTGLHTGTYTCRVTDSRGAFLDVAVVLSPYQFYWSGNPITLAVDAGDAYRQDPATKPGLTFLCEVWLEKEYLSDVFAQVGGTVEQPADRDGRTVFEVQNLLAPFLQYDVPPVGSTAVRRADPVFRRFFLKHAELFGGVPAPATGLARSYVVLGGLNFYEARARTWFSYQEQVKPFLTWEPPVKAVLIDQPEFLYFMVTGGAPAFRCQVRVHFSDGTEAVSTRGGPDGALDYEVYCLPVGYDALALAALATATKQVVWWEVFLTTPDQAAVLSETRRFELDRKTYPKRRFFLFGTSLGGMATYAALGEALLDGEVTGQEAALTLVPDYDPLQGDTSVQARVLRPVVKAASGPRTRAQLLAAQDLLLSKRVLLLSRDGARWQPGYLKAKTVTLLDESKPVQVQEFEFYLPAERWYTPALGGAQVTYATQYQP